MAHLVLCKVELARGGDDDGLEEEEQVKYPTPARHQASIHPRGLGRETLLLLTTTTASQPIQLLSSIWLEESIIMPFIRHAFRIWISCLVNKEEDMKKTNRKPSIINECVPQANY
jgi:hypothetical protein